MRMMILFGTVWLQVLTGPVEMLQALQILGLNWQANG
jgi:hypothetical protein